MSGTSHLQHFSLLPPLQTFALDEVFLLFIWWFMLLFVTSLAAFCRTLQLHNGVLKQGTMGWGSPTCPSVPTPQKPLLGILQYKIRETLLNARNQKKTHPVLSDTCSALK